MYLVTSAAPMDFRLFLLRHSEVLRPLIRWTIRVLVPAPFSRAIRVFGQAAREELATPIEPSTAEGLRGFFPVRQLQQHSQSEAAGERFRSASLAYRTPRFRALFRKWQQDGDAAIFAAQSPVLRDALQRGAGRVEFVKLTRQYLHLAPLVGVA